MKLIKIPRYQDHNVLSSQAGFVISKIKNTFLFLFFQFNQNVLLCLPHQATSVLHLLEPWIATILLTIAAVVNVLRTSHSHVPMTQPLELDSGSQHFALQKAVAAKVSVGDSIVLSLFHEWEDGNAILSCGDECPTFSFSSNTPCMPQVWSPHQTLHFALQKAVAVKVSDNMKMVKISFSSNTPCHR